MRWMLMLMVWLGAATGTLAAEIHVDGGDPFARDVNSGTAERPLTTISAAAARARAGDTVLVHAGTYRESVRLEHSGTAEAPIMFRAVEPGSVVVSGLQRLENWHSVSASQGEHGVQWDHRFSIGHDDRGEPIEHHPEDAPLWGRAEQVLVDGVPLKPVATLAALRADDAVSEANLAPAVAGVGVPFAGAYHISAESQRLAILLRGRADPIGRIVEASTRDLLFGVTPWDGDGEGVQHVHVSGFIFRGAAGFPQRPAVWLHGANNLVEDCIIERNAGAGLKVNGTLRRCLIRDNGHIGGSAVGDGAVNEDCVWLGNSWKPIDRAWEAGGTKIVRARGAVFRDCAFIGNGGPGLWLDIDVRDTRIERCVFERNELSGLFIEISRGITVEHCLARENGLHTDDWGVGGITVAESIDITIRGCELVGNRDGLAVREQGPRVIDTRGGDVPFTVRDLRVERTIGRGNSQFQLAFWWDNPACGPHPSADADDGSVLLRPEDAGLSLHGNAWIVTDAASQQLGLWGVPWRPRSVALNSLGALKRLGFEPTPAAEDVGWPERPDDTTAWARAKLPAWMTDPR